MISKTTGRLFIIQWNVPELIITHGDSPKSVKTNKQTADVKLNIQEPDTSSCSWQHTGRTPLREFFMVKGQCLSLYFHITLNWAEELIMPPASLPNQGLLKSTL